MGAESDLLGWTGNSFELISKWGPSVDGMTSAARSISQAWPRRSLLVAAVMLVKRSQRV